LIRPKGKESGTPTNIPPASLNVVKRFGSGLLEDEWRNMLIFGDNLSVMKALMNSASIRGQVRLVYIDPPFSTNRVFRAGASQTSTVSSSKEDEIAYQDLLVGAEYLEFLRKRLILLKGLLADDGSIYVHIDWKMGHYVKVLMDEIFGQEHFINDITRIKCNPKNFERKGYGNIKDMILFYSKTEDFVWNGSYVSYTDQQLERLFPKVDKDGRRYTTNPLHAPGETENGPTGQSWRGMLPPKGRHWRYPPEVLDQLDRKGLIEWSRTGNPRKKIYADEYMRKKIYRQDIWEFKDPPYPTYPTEKNLEMLKVIVEASSNRGDIVLDCFSGSGTTLVAAEQLDRRWIGIDNSAKAIEVTLKRLQALKKVRPFILYKDDDPLRTLTEALEEVLK
jgi:adenine-specific DNA-methyltransferase